MSDNSKNSIKRFLLSFLKNPLVNAEYKRGRKKNIAQGLIKKAIAIKTNPQIFQNPLPVQIQESIKYIIPSEKNKNVGSGKVVLEKKTLNGSNAYTKAVRSETKFPKYL